MSSALNVNMIYLIYAWPNELVKREFVIRRLGIMDALTAYEIGAALCNNHQMNTSDFVELATYIML